MELRQLRYFLAVVEEAGFTRAAARLHVAQPGVSAQIRQLERELGEPLLDRSGRRVRPTDAGIALLPHARAALDAVEAGRASIVELTGLVRGHVRMGTVGALAAVDVPELLAGFRDRYPAVEISLREAASTQLVEELLVGRLDLILAGSVTMPPNIATQVVADEPVVAVVAQRHALAGRERISAGALRDEPLISLPRGTGLRGCVEELCAAAGFHPNIALETGDPRLVIRMAARGLGLALVTESMARVHADDLHVMALTRAPRARILLAWRTQGVTGPAGRALIRHSRAVLPDPAPELPAHVDA
jgi:DNA-binding transcriptional LysR family regulator